MKNKGDMPAFPTRERSAGSVYMPAYFTGMTYRQWLIGQALKGLLCRPPICGTPANYAAWAIEYADAVIKAENDGHIAP